MAEPTFNEQLRLKELELETLLEITNSLLEFEQVHELLHEILYRACSILNASSGFILIEERNAGLFVPKATFNLNEETLSSILFNSKRGLIADLRQSGKEGSVKLDSSVLRRLEREFSMVAPLTEKKEVIGAIVLLDKEQRKGKTDFSASDQSMLNAIAAQASIAYSNTALLDSLIESQRYGRSVMDSIHAGVMTTNLFGEVDTVNQAAKTLLSAIDTELIGNHYEIIFESDAPFLEMLRKVEQESITVKETDYHLKVGDGSLLVNLTVSPLIDETKSIIGLVIAMEDISDLDKVRSTFKKYVSKQIVDQILQHQNQLDLGGQELEVTTLFSDIRGFTSMSERLSPMDVVNSLNEYFDIMIEVIFKYNGTLDKIIGDALMVIYGAPIGASDDAERALRTAIEMQQRLAELNRTRHGRGQEPLHIGIGLNTGKVVAGNIGSKEQMNYTVIGDAVNLSARLCSHAAAGQVIVSDNVHRLLNDHPDFAFKRLEPIQVKGKSEKIAVYDVWYFKHDLTTSKEERLAMIEEFLLVNLPDHLIYHSIDHIRDVVEMSMLHGRNEGLDQKELELVKTAAWLHDIGYIWDESNHEERGCRFARENMPMWGFSQEDIDAVCGMIMATRIPQSPKCKMDRVLCDADLDYLGRSDYEPISLRLKKELSRKRSLSESEWRELQLKFFHSHRYFTESATRLRDGMKKANQERLTNKST